MNPLTVVRMIDEVVADFSSCPLVHGAEPPEPQMFAARRLARRLGPVLGAVRDEEEDDSDEEQDRRQLPELREQRVRQEARRVRNQFLLQANGFLAFLKIIHFCVR